MDKVAALAPTTMSTFQPLGKRFVEGALQRCNMEAVRVPCTASPAFDPSPQGCIYATHAAKCILYPRGGGQILSRESGHL